MRVEFIQCDVCEKKHDAQYILPPEWITTIQHKPSGLEVEHHFCSKACLVKWACEEEVRAKS